MKKLLLILTTIALASSTIFAGEVLQLKCSNKNCTYKSKKFLSGSGKTQIKEDVFYHCTKCNEIGMLTIKQGPRTKKSKVKVIDIKPVTKLSIGNKYYDLYLCPKCKKPVIGLPNLSSFKICPDCGKNTLRNAGTIGKWD